MLCLCTNKDTTASDSRGGELRQDQRGRVSGEAQTLGDVLTGTSVVICQTRTEAAADAEAADRAWRASVLLEASCVVLCCLCCIVFMCRSCWTLLKERLGKTLK